MVTGQDDVEGVRFSEFRVSSETAPYTTIALSGLHCLPNIPGNKFSTRGFIGRTSERRRASEIVAGRDV